MAVASKACAAHSSTMESGTRIPAHAQTITRPRGNARVGLLYDALFCGGEG